MYKRRVRILFWHPTDPAKARYAATLAEALGADWLEARMDEPDHAWPDLLIALDCRTAPDIPRATHTQCKYWPLAQGSWKDAVRARITGVIGGLRLLARMDQSPAPGHAAAPFDKALRLN
ncbi:hypothetical protein [Acidithiobacillus sp.]|jgi:hypothetical protein|uniref:hypothetical protein n=1 Tax=Acidithiobacillus sp. TaxID=1872118 RepID=UPI002605EDFC|nr:hypothetical protein [Acidithiobacillus sp.]